MNVDFARRIPNKINCFAYLCGEWPSINRINEFYAGFLCNSMKIPHAGTAAYSSSPLSSSVTGTLFNSRLTAMSALVGMPCSVNSFSCSLT